MHENKGNDKKKPKTSFEHIESNGRSYPYLYFIQDPHFCLNTIPHVSMKFSHL